MAEPGLDVLACLVRVRQQDQAAAEQLVEHLYPLVIRLVRANLPRRMSEEDLAQEVFMKMFANLEQYQGTVPLEHWVSRIAVNTCLNQLRAQKVRPELRWADLSEEEARVLDAIATVDEKPLPSETMAGKELLDKLLECLPPKDRLIIQLLELEELSLLEINERTGWSTAMIRVRAFRARHKLRARYAKLLREEKHE